MKHIYLIALLSMILFYIATSFILWDFNASNWPNGARAFILIFPAITVSVVLLINKIYK